MDEINDFFNFSKPFKREIISGGYVDGRTVKPESTNQPPAKLENMGTEYVEEHRAREHANLTQAFSQKKKSPTGSDAGSTAGSSATFKQEQSRLDDLESESGDFMREPHDGSDADDDAKPNHGRDFNTDTSVYDRYPFHYVEPNLPIVASRSHILRTIDAHPVTVLQGFTGCGKSTQLPQFILDQARERREHCNIVVTQPRRIAARSICMRVCAERKWECGSLVGFQVGLSTHSSEDTRLLFCTTGVLLEKLVQTKSLAQFTHLVLDEVHERDQDMDFLFIVVRRLLAVSPQCKIVLMSATIEAHQFAEYFRIGERQAPVVSVDAIRSFVVREFYLCDLVKLNINVDITIDNPTIDADMYEGVRKLVMVMQRIDNQDNLAQPGKASRVRPTILIFLPGILEIDMMYKKLEEDAVREKYFLMPLHSSITFEEQQRAFRPVAIDMRKIVLTTNIAESSVTIPDVKYVFDMCLTKQQVTDTSTGFSSLQLCWASRNNCIQRSGRAGRVMDGRVYRMVPRIFYENLMQQQGEPEMVRSPLDRVVLKAKMLKMGAPHAILAAAMDPPRLSDIQNTVMQLKEMGGLLCNVNGEFMQHDGDLTYIGRVMAALPLDCRVTRLIIFGYCFSVLEECIIIAAGLNVKSIFNTPFNKHLQAYSKKLRWADGSGSDLFAILKAYRCWLAQHRQNIFADDQAERLWASRFYLQVRSLKEMNVLVTELTDRLDRLGIRRGSGMAAVNWTSAERSIVLKCVIAGAFYPNYFMRTPFHQENDRDAHKELCGRDPSTTVFFRGFNHLHIGALYTKAIKRMFSEVCRTSKQMHVSFDPSTEKIFVQFRPDLPEPGEEYVETMPGQVAIEVYKAVKMRTSRTGRFTLAVMSPKEAIDQAELMGLGICKSGHWVPRVRRYKNIEMIAVPLPSVATVQGLVSHVDTPHRFFFQSRDEQTFVRQIFDELNAGSAKLRPFRQPQDVLRGRAVVVVVDGARHRGRISHVIQHAQDAAWMYQVRLIDFGAEHQCKFGDLLRYDLTTAQYAEVPPRAFECRLAEVQPSQLTAEKGLWTADAVLAFRTLVCDGQPAVELNVYSVVNRVAHVVAFVGAGGSSNVNEFLIGEGMAQVCDESYASKSNHIRRLECQRRSANDAGAQAIEDEMVAQMAGDLPSDDDCDADEPNATQCYLNVQLSGPHSPLEAHVYGAAGAAQHRTVRIEPNSVNSVLLEDRSQDVHNNVLVAASVTQSSQGTTHLVARETSLMPTIPGFGALMALVFCPVAELKPDARRSRIVSVLCGMGWNRQTSRPAYEEHDVQFELDVDVNATDMAWINQIRFTMDALMYTQLNEERPNLTDMQKNHYLLKIKQRIIELLERSRDRISAPPTNTVHRWGHDADIETIVTTKLYGDRTIFPFHELLRLTDPQTPENQQQVLRQRNNCAELHRVARLDLSLAQPIACALCQILLSSAPEVQMHLFSRLHVDREKYVGFLKEE